MTPLQIDMLKDIILINNGNIFVNSNEEFGMLSISALRYVLDAADEETIQGALDRSYVSEESTIEALAPKLDTEYLSAEQIAEFEEEYESAEARWRQRCSRIAQRMYNANTAIIEETQRAEQARMDEEARVQDAHMAAESAYGELLVLRREEERLRAQEAREEARLLEVERVRISNEGTAALFQRISELVGRPQSPQSHDLTQDELMTLSGDDYSDYIAITNRIFDVRAEVTHSGVDGEVEYGSEGDDEWLDLDSVQSDWLWNEQEELIEETHRQADRQGLLNFLRENLSPEDFALHPLAIEEAVVVEAARLQEAFDAAEQAYQEHLWEQGGAGREERDAAAEQAIARGLAAEAMYQRASEMSGRPQSAESHDLTFEEQSQLSPDDYWRYRRITDRIAYVSLGLHHIEDEFDSTLHHWEWQRTMGAESRRVDHLNVLRENLSPEDFEQHPLQLAAPSALTSFDEWRMTDLRGGTSPGANGMNSEEVFRQEYPNHHFREEILTFHESISDYQRREHLGISSRLEFLIHVGCTKYLEDPVEAERLHELLLQEIEEVNQANFENERASFVEHYIFRLNGREIDEEVMEAHWRDRWIQVFGGEDEYNTRRANAFAPGSESFQPE